jgi:hypothetical protein
MLFVDRWITKCDIALIAGRFYGNRGLRTSIGTISLKTGVVKELLRLPSGGDTGYPGLVLIDNTLYVTYYTQPQGLDSTAIMFTAIDVQY